MAWMVFIVILLVATIVTAFTIPNEWVESGRKSRLPNFVLPKERNDKI